MNAVIKELKRLLVLVVIQQKGGVGKTSIAKSLGIYFSTIRKCRTLLMDFDPQCNLSNKFIEMKKMQGIKGYIPPMHPQADEYEDEDWDGKSSTASMFFGEPIIPYPTEFDLLEIIPGEGDRLTKAQENNPAELESKIINRPREFVLDPAIAEVTDLVIIDTPPSRQALTRGALRAATHIIVPMEPEPNSEEGLSDMIELWREENFQRDESDPANLIGVLPNLVMQYGKHEMGLHAGIIDSLRGDPALASHILPFVIHHKPVVAETDSEFSKYRSVFDLDKNNKGRKEFEVMCRHVENELFGNVTRR